LNFRRIQELPLQQSHLPLFIMPWLLMHVIDPKSPLHGHTAETLAQGGIRIFLTLEVLDHALSATVQDMKDYAPPHIRFGMRFVDMVIHDDAGGTTADLSRISLLEPDNATSIKPDAALRQIRHSGT
jgi:inward rectifier potassium channel